MVNKRIGIIKQAFKWGVAQEFVPPSVHHELQAVSGLKKGRTEAPDHAPICPSPRPTFRLRCRFSPPWWPIWYGFSV